MPWICSNWTTDWNAVGSVSTLLAVIVALVFGLRESFQRVVERRSKRAMVSSAMLHAVSITRQQASFNADSMTTDKVEAHRGRLAEYGKVLRINGATELARHSALVSVLGRESASHFAYGLGLLEESNHFFDWLAQLGSMNDSGWNVLKSQFAVREETLRQSATALRWLELKIAKYVPEEILKLRHGDEWKDYFDPANMSPAIGVSVDSRA